MAGVSGVSESCSHFWYSSRSLRARRGGGAGEADAAAGDEERAACGFLRRHSGLAAAAGTRGTTSTTGRLATCPPCRPPARGRFRASERLYPAIASRPSVPPDGHQEGRRASEDRSDPSRRGCDALPAAHHDFTQRVGGGPEKAALPLPTAGNSVYSKSAKKKEKMKP